uniref:AGBL carboxypeptidase 4 n=1 Tax=Electrophorus electricus TaxID=8005 RepID=A0AAY5EQ93_ELEEL
PPSLSFPPPAPLRPAPPPDWSSLAPCLLCSLMGFDLNRHWQDPSPWAHPTLHAVKQLIVQMNQDPKVSLEFYIDVHSHSTMMNGFMYGNVFEEEGRVQRQAVFPRLLCHNAPDFSLSSTSFNRDVVKAGTGRRFLGGLLDDTSYCYTLEVSFYSYVTAGSATPVPYTEDGCILPPAGPSLCPSSGWDSHLGGPLRGGAVEHFAHIEFSLLMYMNG